MLPLASSTRFTAGNSDHRRCGGSVWRQKSPKQRRRRSFIWRRSEGLDGIASLMSLQVEQSKRMKKSKAREENQQTSERGDKTEPRKGKHIEMTFKQREAIKVRSGLLSFLMRRFLPEPFLCSSSEMSKIQFLQPKRNPSKILF